MLANYDSFTYNLVQELGEVGEVEIEVVRNDAATADELLALGPQAIVISPGPGVPEDAGVSMDLVRAAAGLPLLGSCPATRRLRRSTAGGLFAPRSPSTGRPLRSDIRGRGSSKTCPMDSRRPAITRSLLTGRACRRVSRSRRGPTTAR